MATAIVLRSTGSETREPFSSAELAARHLEFLLKLDGWQGEAVGRLTEGERITHKRYTYWVED